MTNDKPRGLTPSITLLLVIGSAVSYADPGHTPPCKTPSECMAEVLCPGILTCRNNHGDPVPYIDPDTGLHSYDFLDPNFTSLNRHLIRCLDTLTDAFKSCTQAICSETFLNAPASPSFAGCMTDWNNRRTAYFTNSHQDICTGLPLFIHPSEYSVYHEMCVRAADALLARCLSLVLNPSPAQAMAIQDGLFLDGVFASERASSIRGEVDGSALWIPMHIDSPPVTEIALYTQSIDGGSSVVSEIGVYGFSDDGTIEVRIDVSDIPSALYQRSLPVVLQWRNGNETVHAQMFRIAVEDSGIPGDFNRDGARTVEDLTAYIDAYQNSAPRADLNWDGVVDAADFELFLMQFDGN